MVKGYPWQKWVTRDWLNDHCLGACSPATRGIWVDMLCVMDEADDFQLTGTAAALARLCRASEAEMAGSLDELLETCTADVSEETPGVFQVISRRRKREYGNRLRDRVRKRPDEFQDDSGRIPPTDKKIRREEDKKKKKKTPPKPPRRGGVHPDFDAWWEHYPKKVDKKNAQVKFPKAMRIAESLQVLIEGAQRYARTTEVKYYMSPAKWLHGERWNDEQQESGPGKRGIGGTRDFGRGISPAE